MSSNYGSIEKLEPGISDKRKSHRSSGGETWETSDSIPVAFPRSYYACATIACLSGINFGYDVGSSGGAGILMKYDMGWTDLQVEIFLGSVNIFSAFGGLVSGLVCDTFGRRGALQFSMLMFASGVSIICSSQSFIQSMIGQSIVGFCLGLALAIGPLYISELAPPELRGGSVSCLEISIGFGILVGFTADFFFVKLLPDDIAWRGMMAAGLLMPAVIFFLATTVMLESPRWLIANDRREEAVRVLEKVYPKGTDAVALADEIESRIQAEKVLKQGWGHIFCPTRSVRLMLLAGVGVAIMQQVNGGESLVYYSPTLLEKAGVDSREKQFALTILIGFSKAAFTIVAVLNADSWGRRPLLLFSAVGIGVCLLFLAAASYLGNILLQLCSMFAFMGLFSLGMGPIVWAVASEVFSNPIRAKAISLATFSNRFTAGVVSLTCLSTVKLLGITGYFLLYAFLTFLSAVYMYIYVPETKGMSLEEIQDLFENEQ